MWSKFLIVMSKIYGIHSQLHHALPLKLVFIIMGIMCTPTTPLHLCMHHTHTAICPALQAGEGQCREASREHVEGKHLPPHLDLVCLSHTQVGHHV